MFDDDPIGIGVAQRIDTKLADQKSLLVGLSRGIDKLAGRRGGKAEERARPADMVVRAAVSELLRPMTPTASGGVLYEKDAGDMARSLYADDHRLHDFVERFITRAASPPASTTTPGYASELMSTATVDFLTNTEAPSGFAQLSQQCLSVAVQGSVKVPSRVYPLALAGGWVGEGAPKPVYALSLATVTLAPSKLVALTAWSDEIAAYSTPSIEALVRDALKHDLGALLDSTAFGTAAGTSTQPAGLFFGAIAVTASSAASLTDAMMSDLAALAGAVSTNAPGARVLFIVNPRQALRLSLVAPEFSVIQSGYMSPNAVGAVDADSIVTMVSDIIFKASSDATVRMSDPATALGTPGSPNAISAPTLSLFQANLVGLRSVLRCSWAKRRAGCSALATSVAW